MKGRFTTVSIPKPLAAKANKMIRETGFTSLSSFVEYLLREVVSKRNPAKKNEVVELESVEERLRKLGYM